MVLHCGEHGLPIVHRKPRTDCRCAVNRRPSPLFNYTKVSIGDVGYVYNGRFNKLFNATNPPPSDFLHGMPSYRPGATHYDPPSSPGALYFGTIQRKGVRFGVESQLYVVLENTITLASRLNHHSQGVRRFRG